MIKTFISRIMSIEPIRRQSIVSLIWQILFTFIGFLSTVYFAREVGADVLGAYFLFISYFGIINLFTHGGFEGAAIKRISEGNEPDAYFSAVAVLRLVFTTIVILALLLLKNYFVDFNNAGIFVWLLIAIIVAQLNGLVSSGNSGCGKIGITSTANFIDKITRIFVQVIAIFIGYDIIGLTGGFVVGMFVGFILQIRFLNLQFVKFEWRHIKSLSSFSFWAFLISGGGLVFVYFDSIMIGYYLNNSDVGIYRIIFQFTMFAGFVMTSITVVLWPKISRWNETKEISLIELSLSRTTTYALILAVPFVIGGILLGDRTLCILYGSEFENYNTLIILLLTQIMIIFHQLFSTYLSVMNQIKNVFKVSVIGIICNLTLNILLIPILGIVGAGIATFITMFLNAILSKRILEKSITFKTEKSIVNIIVASTIMGLFVGIYRLLIPISNIWLLIIPIVIGSIIYMLLILKFDEKIRKELKNIIFQI